MKPVNKLYTTLLAVIVIAAGCQKKLEEQPKSLLVPSFLQTGQGLQNALTSAYSGMRFQYGPEGAMALAVVGTDEFTTGSLGGGSLENDFNTYGTNLNAANGQLTTPWNNNFTYINTCNAIVDLGPDATGIDDNAKKILMAEAKFLRAHYYFILLQNFQNVPLDLGSGTLKYNSTPSTTSQPSPVADVYAAIIQDLQDAATGLPDKPALAGKAGKAAAMHMLAKAYLTRATSTAKQTDDYLNAFNTAKSLIDNQSTYGVGLEQDFAGVNKQGNEHGKENLWTVEHTINYTFSETGPNGNGGAANGLKENRSNFFFTPYYESHGLTPTSTNRPVVRDVQNQRPWVRFEPTSWLVNICFADKVNDSRYNNTFKTVWYANRAVDGLAIGDTAFYLPGYEVTPEERATHTYRIYAPSEYSNGNDPMYPHMIKYADTLRLQANDPPTRPFIVAKLSETYLIAAEAALITGQTAAAMDYINVLRQRAAYRSNNSQVQNAAAVAAMTLINPTDVTLDFILDERSRELCGENLRWYDLVRTGKLIERAKLYNKQAALNIQEKHVIRPIPQSQIDLTTGTKYPQNPGW